ncbi:hypothetical protein [Roseovarius pacificus]|uniref:hypothetical protein n=1 Tax=Roseovarius pacificus TaxID=337701 RepID=UPI002A18B017|nr:hypothetical protein [Roseovarius pacificus]
MPAEAWAVLLACALTPVFVGCHIALSRVGSQEVPGAQSLFLAAGGYVAIWLVAALALWGYSLSLGQAIAGLATAGFVVLAYMQVYSQIARGFSLRILVDVARCGGLDIHGILREYSDGRGAQWLIDKRLVGLEHTGMATRRDGGLALERPKGALVGRMGLVVKRILKPGQDG